MIVSVYLTPQGYPWTLDHLTPGAAESVAAYTSRWCAKEAAYMAMTAPRTALKPYLHRAARLQANKGRRTLPRTDPLYLPPIQRTKKG
jgi:hypothetical protein